MRRLATVLGAIGFMCVRLAFAQEGRNGAQLVLAARANYPSILAQAGVQGSVEFEISVDSLGVPQRSTWRSVLSTHPLFEASARDAVLRWLFAPDRVNGHYVASVVHYRVRFAL